MKRIIVPTDFSEGAWNALQYALALARHFQAEILIINTYEEPQAGVSSLISIRNILQKESESGLEELKAKVQNLKIADGLTVNYRSYYGSITMAINDYTENYTDQMVVMGSLGESGRLEKLIGSNASYVIQHCACPVLVVPLQAKIKHPHKVVFAADFHKIPSNTNLKLLQSLCLWSPADKLDVLHIDDEEKDSVLDLEVFESFIHDIPHQTQVIQGKEVAETIDRYMVEHEADLLVMIKQKKGFFERLFKGSVTKEVSLYANTPILVLKAL